MSLTQIRNGYLKKDFVPSEVVQYFFNRIEKHNSKVNAVTSVNARALNLAKEMDAKAAQSVEKLYGIPLGIKEMFCTKGLLTTAASKILSNFVPPYSATVVERLEKAGALVLCKTNQDEFAMGSSNEQSYHGACKNPWNLEYVPGGSSGGSAAFVAAGLGPASLGTDTGGSIRQPASFCGIVGVKPTYGRISRYGIIAFASSLDQAGPMTRTVEDAALMLEVMCGADSKDATTARAEVPEWSKKLNPNMKGIKVGILKEYTSDDIDPEIRKKMEETKAHLKETGAEFVEVSVPLTEFAVPVYYLVAASEASSNLSRYDGVRFGYRSDFSKKPAEDLEEFYSRSRGEGFGLEVKRRILIGTYSLSSGYYDAYYRKAGQVRRLLRDEFLKAFEKCDVILSPVATTAAFKIGARVDDPLKMYLNDIFTTATNLVGMPGMSVPVGFTSSGLPIGLQLTARHFEEQKMLNVAYAMERQFQLTERIPDVCS
ncbi:MAG: Asp-tRNA(Asn)/Glu-tRNA(Gln) amidotransferase subunit GatA [Bdellovibrionales bacterium]|nr:Asp-tRNA(Asn)/Glu-tRNA(Gln) amidotransferase subunit GatA [Bdellovibrionales bacterium]